MVKVLSVDASPRAFVDSLKRIHILELQVDVESLMDFQAQFGLRAAADAIYRVVAEAIKCEMEGKR